MRAGQGLDGLRRPGLGAAPSPPLGREPARPSPRAGSSHAEGGAAGARRPSARQRLLGGRSGGAAPVLGTLALALAAGACSRPAAEPWTVLLVTVDDLRADQLAPDSLGDELPHLARLVAESAVARDFVTSSTATNAALAALLTGLPPARDGVRSVARFGRWRLGERAGTLAGRLRLEGWHTLAAVPLRQLEAHISGLDRGFEDYLDEGLPRSGAPLADAAVTARFRAALAPLCAGHQPVFGWLHLGGLRDTAELPSERLAAPLLAALAPYRTASAEIDAAYAPALPPVEAVARLRAAVGRQRGGEPWRALRRAEARARLGELDRALGGLEDALAAAGRLDRAALVLVGTRGSYLDEPRPDGRVEGSSEGLIRTPLVMCLPGALPPGWIEGTLDSTSVAPRLLLAVLGQRPPPPEEPARVDSPRAGTLALVEGGWKLIGAPGAEPLVVRRADDVPVPLEEIEDETERSRLASWRRLLDPPEGLRIELAAAADLADVELVLRAAAPVLGECGPHEGIEARVDQRRVLQLSVARLAAGEKRALVVDADDACVPLELEVRVGGRAPEAGAVSVRALGQASEPLLPRLAPRDGERWDAAPGEADPWLVDVARGVGGGLRIRATDPARAGARVRVWATDGDPPVPFREWRATGAGCRVQSAPALAGGLVVEGELPLDFTLGRPGGDLGLALTIAGEPVPAARIRFLGERFAPGADGALRLALPPWLPARTDWLSPALPDGAPVGENGAPVLRITFDREALPQDLPEGPLGITPEELRFLQRLGTRE